MQRKFRVLALLFIVLISVSLMGCGGSGSSGPVTSPTPTPTNPKVYVAGYYYSDAIGSNQLPCYWIDGTRYSLNLPSGVTSGQAEAIFVYNSTIYTSGSYYDGSNYQPCYWINTTIEPLTLPALTVQGTAHAITVANDGTVYTAGECLNTDGSLTIPCYWQNDTVPVDLSPAGTTISSAYTIQISNGVIYIGGYYKDSSNYNKPCYWYGTSHPLNSIANKFSLPAGENNGNIISLFVVGESCYAAGSTSQACYWRNSGSNPIPISGTVSLSSIHVANGVIYIAGTQNDLPYYWTDSGTGATSVKLVLPDSASVADASSIYVLGGVPYCAGVYNDGSKDIACYWSGNSRTDLPNGVLDSDANAIFVEK